VETILLDGKRLSREIQREIREEVEKLERAPTLALVQVGDDPASSVYVRSKVKACENCGILSDYRHLSAEVSREELLDTLAELNEDDRVDGILLQLPLPPHLDADEAIQRIDPRKDVDGFHPENLGRLASGRPRFVPCTPLGIREMLRRYRVPIEGRRVVVLGRSVIVGRPLALLLSLKGEGGDATVTICHSRTRDLPGITREADILVAAMGRPAFVGAEMVKEGAVVVDVGINRVPDDTRPKGYRLVGDVDFDAVRPKASAITPVPGGVGPMTVAMLMANTLRAHRMRHGMASDRA
jgi:methylenetetrahydrofolate dehydrogenase (NADP+)/methenyltetrahydrofolate cyclohydrolase